MSRFLTGEELMRKVLQIIESCNGCPNRRYSSGGAYDCTLLDERIPEEVVIAPFCPLTDYPSRIIAEMATTIHLLRKQNTTSFTLGILSLIATKLELNVRSDYLGIDIPLQDGTVVHLSGYDFECDLIGLQVVQFNYNGTKYQLHLNQEPSLHKAVRTGEDLEEHWQECKLTR